jgi:transglutaminase-like putative cysteine protease
VNPPENPVRRLFDWSLLGMLVAAYLALATTGLVDLLSLAAAGLAILARALKLGGAIRFELSDRAANASALAYLGFLPIDYHWLSRDFLVAAVHLTFFLVSVIVLRARTRRDFFFVKLSALLMMTAACVLAYSISYFVFFAAFGFCGLLAQLSGQLLASMADQTRLARGSTGAVAGRLLKLGGLIFIGVLSVAGVLFLILPRTALAMIQHWTPDRVRLPGFANEVRLGQIGEIQLRHTPVMHVRFRASALTPLKWRGSGLTRFDGKRWYNDYRIDDPLPVEDLRLRLTSPVRNAPPSSRVDFEVQLKDATGDVLFFPGSLEMLYVNAPYVYRTAADSYRLGRGQGRGARYGGVGLIETAGQVASSERSLSPRQRAEYLQLPPMDPRIAALAASLAAGSPGQHQIARRFEQYLRSTYQYAIEPVKEEIPEPVAYFLFERKAGHCEYFASAMTVMLRTMGIASRVVTGFQTGVYNPLTGWHLIRASDAHSWVEAFVEGHGWTTFDPTPAAPPADSQSVLATAGLYWDAAEVFWQEWVMSYDLDRQFALAERAGQGSRALSESWARTWQGLRRGLVDVVQRWWRWVAGILAAGLLLFRLRHWFRRECAGAWTAFQHRRRILRGTAMGSDATLLYQKMLATLARRGVEKPGWMTASEFARTIDNAPARTLVSEFTRTYEEARFGGRVGSAPRLVALLEQLRSFRQAI